MSYSHLEQKNQLIPIWCKTENFLKDKIQFEKFKYLKLVNTIVT